MSCITQGNSEGGEIGERNMKFPWILPREKSLRTRRDLRRVPGAFRYNSVPSVGAEITIVTLLNLIATTIGNKCLHKQSKAESG